jgi:hypothetical protein
MLFALAALAIQAASAAMPIGVAHVSAAGQMCVAMPSPPVAAGASITLVQPSPPQSAMVATIERSVASCVGLEQAMISGPYYVARAGNSSVAEPGTLWVAFAGAKEFRIDTSGDVVVRLDAGYPAARIRSCASSEGIHLTVWAGIPLRSGRLWHEYYYLQYDLEPSCDDAEVSDPTG